MLFVLSSCKENEVSPYLNYSSEECIVDEECVWDAFERIAFGSVIEGTKELDYIRKWTSSRPVVVGIISKNNEKFEVMIKHHAKKAGEYIDHPIKMWEPDLDTNMAIIFADDLDEAIHHTYRKSIEETYERTHNDKNYLFKAYENLKRTKVISCFSDIGHNKENKEILISMIFVKTDMDMKDIYSCVQNQITHSLGLVNNFRKAKFTTFNEFRPKQFLTSLDWLLLQILYHKNIKPGMNKKDVKQKFSTIYNQLSNEKHND
jgi:predicted transcriptional regulator